MAEYLNPYETNGQADSPGYFIATTQEETETTLITAAQMHPFIADFDNDTINEIMIVDDDTLEFYANTTIDLIDGFTAPSTIQAAYIYDITNDDTLEIIIVTGNNNLSIINYEAGNITVHASHTISINALAGGNYIISCNTPTECLLVLPDADQVSYANTHVKVALFNSSYYQVNSILERSTGSSSSYRQVFCMPNIPFASIYDIDEDGTNNYIFNTYFGSAFLTDRYYTVSVQSNTTHMILSNSGYIDSAYSEFTGSDSCTTNDNEYSKLMTSPVVLNFDGFGSNGHEVIFGYMKGTDEFKIRSLKNDLTHLDSFPEILDADGIIISNPIVFNSFSDTGTEDVCVLGFQQTSEEIDLLCASKQTSGVESKEFTYDISTMGNILSGSSIYNNHIMGGDFYTTYVEGTDLDELITPYGVFELSYTGVNHLNLLFESPDVETSVVSTDLNNDDRQELFFLGESILYLLTDGYENLNTYSLNSYVDPTNPVCYGYTTVINMDLYDADNDIGTCYVNEYYANGTFKSLETTQSTATPTNDFILVYQADEIGNFNLKVSCNDSSHTAVELFNFPVIVSNDTNVCHRPYYGHTQTIYIDTTITTEIEFENNVDDALADIGIVSDYAKSMFWMILMIGLAFLLFATFQIHNPFILIIVEVMMLVLGWVLGFIGAVPLVIIGLISSVILVMMFKGNSGGV